MTAAMLPCIERLVIAGKATKGPWKSDEVVTRKKDFEPSYVVKDKDGFTIVDVLPVSAYQANAAHIAASSPDVVQADIEEILRLRAENERLRRISIRSMDVAICLAAMMENNHELCPRDCDVSPSAIRCNQYTDFNGEADCDATKCWLHVALHYSADCQHNDEDMGDFHALYEAMLRKEVRKTVEEEERHG